MEKLKIGCIVLAAGNSTRFSSNKLLYEIDGVSVIDRTFQAIPSRLFSEVVVVTQYSAVAEKASAKDFRPIMNHSPGEGISFSIRLGLDALISCDAALFTVADQPFMTAGSIEELVSIYLTSPQRPAAVSCRGVRGNPCIFPRSFFPALMGLRGDKGGNVLLKNNEISLLEVTPRELADIDTPEDVTLL